MQSGQMSPANLLRLATAIQQDAHGFGFSGKIQSAESVGAEQVFPRRFDELVTVPALIDASRDFFASGHYSSAVEKAFVCVNNEVQVKSGLESKDGADLMWTAFNVNSPVLTLNKLESISEINEQKGFMHIFAGSMMGIRNPRAHDHQRVDDPASALEYLAMANCLLKQLSNSQVQNSTNSADRG